MPSESYNRFEQKIDKIFDQLSIIQQSVVELRTERINTSKEIDYNRTEILQIKNTVDDIKQEMEQLNTKVVLISAGITVAVSFILMIANWLLGKY